MIQKKLKQLGLVALGLILALSFLLCFCAYNNAHAMTHFQTTTKLPKVVFETMTPAQKIVMIFQGIKKAQPINRRDPSDLGLDFQTMEIKKWVTHLELWVIPPQDKPKGNFLLFHGYGGRKQDVLTAAKIVNQLGYQSIAVDFFGSGGSTGNSTTIGAHEAENVKSCFDYAKKTWPGLKTYLLGTSMGAAAILKAGARHGVEADGMVVINPFDNFLNTIKNRFSSMDVPSFPLAHLIVFFAGQIHGFDGFDLNPSEFAETINCPVLHLQGKRDPKVTNEQAESIFIEFRKPSTFHYFPKAGHAFFPRSHPEKFEELLVAFLQRT